MLKSMVRRLEVQMMYGQVGLGTVAADAAPGQVFIDIDAHEWAPGIWSGSENMPIDIYSPGPTPTLRTSAVVQSNDLGLKRITTATDLGAAGVLAGDVIYYRLAKDNEFAGIHKIITNSGTLFNIDASQFSLFRGNVVEVGSDFAGNEAPLSFAKIEEAIAVAMEKGLADEDVVVICNPKSWNNLLTEQSAKRRYDSSFSADKVKEGASAIEFYGQNGKIEIMASIYCKEGYAYVLPKGEMVRVGSSDVTFELPGRSGEFFRILENANAYEMRCYCDQALFTASPGLCTLLTFIKS